MSDKKMMPGEIMKLIKMIEATPGRNDKADMLKTLVSDPLGEWIVTMTYDPFITYGIRPKMYFETESRTYVVFTRSLIEPLLNGLAKREISGTEAKDKVTEVFEALDDDGRDILYRILSKDLRIGASANTINIAKPGLIPQFKVARAQPYEPKRVKKWPQKCEYKLDGHRNTFMCKGSNVGFFSRSGKRVDSLTFFIPALMKAAKAAAVHSDCSELREVITDKKTGELGFVLDGEAIMGLFEESGALMRKDTDAVGSELHLYDIMSYDDFVSRSPSSDNLVTRRKHLAKFVSIAQDVLADTEYSEMIQIVPQYFVNSDEEVQKFFELARSKTLASYLARGNASREASLLKTTIDKATGRPKVLEGVMIKNPDGLYQKKKSFEWLKVKAEETEDLVVVGAYAGAQGTKYENCLGGLVVNRNGVLVRVGGGFSDEERKSLWNDWLFDFKYAVNIDPGIEFVDEKDAQICTKEPPAGCELIGRVVEIEYNEVTPDLSLRHPRFIRFRDDKIGEDKGDE